MKGTPDGEGRPRGATSSGAAPSRTKPKWAKPNHKCSTCKGRRFEDNEELYLDRTTGQWTRSCSVCLAKRRKPRNEPQPQPQPASWLAPAAPEPPAPAPAPPGYWFPTLGWDMRYTAQPPEGHPPFAMSGGFPLHPAFLSPTTAYVRQLHALQARVMNASPALVQPSLPRRSGPPQSPRRAGGRGSERFSAPAASSIIGMPSRLEMHKPSPGPHFTPTPTSELAANPLDPARGPPSTPAWRNSVSYPAVANAAGWMVGAAHGRMDPRQEPPVPAPHAAWAKHSMTQHMLPPQYGWGGPFHPSDSYNYALAYRYGLAQMPPPEAIHQAFVSSSEERGSSEGESKLIPLATVTAAAAASTASSSSSAVAHAVPRPPSWMEGSTRRRPWQPPPPVDTGRARARPQGSEGGAARDPAPSSGHTTSSDSQQRRTAASRRHGAGGVSPGFLLAQSVHPLGSPPAALGIAQGEIGSQWASRVVGPGHLPPSRKRGRASQDAAQPGSAPVASRRRLRSDRRRVPAGRGDTTPGDKWREQLPQQSADAAAAPAPAAPEPEPAQEPVRDVVGADETKRHREQ